MNFIQFTLMKILELIGDIVDQSKKTIRLLKELDKRVTELEDRITPNTPEDTTTKRRFFECVKVDPKWSEPFFTIGSIYMLNEGTQALGWMQDDTYHSNQRRHHVDKHFLREYFKEVTGDSPSEPKRVLHEVDPENLKIGKSYLFVDLDGDESDNWDCLAFCHVYASDCFVYHFNDDSGRECGERRPYVHNATAYFELPHED
jgi:hypothetical protein